MKRCIIVSACPVSPSLARYIQPGDYIIACDAGYRNLQALGVQADWIVGDFDSAPRPQTQAQLTVLPHEKDDTDTHYAARMAVENGFKEVVLLGALGGKRLEHTLANLATGLYLTRQGRRVLLANEFSEVQYLCPGQPLLLSRQDYQYFSIFPLQETLQGLDIAGAKYELQNAQLRVEYPLGVSNEFVQPQVRLCCREGYAAVLLTRDDG